MLVTVRAQRRVNAVDFLKITDCIKAGVHLKAVFTPPKIGLTEISRSRFKQYKNPTLVTQMNVLGCFVNFSW